MKPATKGLILAAIHIAVVSSLGAKLLIDRARLPRVWAKGEPFDPNLPIRGRYVSLSLIVDLEGTTSGQFSYESDATLAVKNGRLVAVLGDQPTGRRVRRLRWEPQPGPWKGELLARLAEPVAFFIPEHIPDPSRRPEGEELWVEVTVPEKGPPRPIRLGVKKNSVLTPLELD